MAWDFILATARQALKSSRSFVIFNLTQCIKHSQKRLNHLTTFFNNRYHTDVKTKSYSAAKLWFTLSKMDRAGTSCNEWNTIIEEITTATPPTSRFQAIQVRKPPSLT